VTKPYWQCHYWVVSDLVHGKTNGTDSSTYMLLLIDPDAPTPDDPKFAFWRHWVVSGLKPDAASASNENSPSVLTEFLGPGPKDESVHRLERCAVLR